MPTVLLVEPYQPLARALCGGLAEEGWDVALARSAEEADALARSRAYAVAVVDLDPPRGAGLALVRGWRRDGLGLPVLLFTLPGQVVGPYADDLGVFDAACKPVPFEELLERLNALLGASTAPG